MTTRLESKADFQELLLKILQPLKPNYSESGALLDLGRTSAHYPDRVAMLEAFARPLWGLAPLWKGGGEAEDLAEVYRGGFSAGPNPDHPDYWDASGEANQRYVEMAALSLGLLLAPERLWEPLSEDEKTNLAKWLWKINTIDINAYPDCNWWFFVVLTNLALRKLERPYHQELVDYAFERVEAFYIGDGWYQDGLSSRKDYYISFAMHFYSLIYSAIMEQDDPDRCRLYRQRADIFAKDFLYWFDENGRGVPYGRSLTYRFAQGAFWSAYVYAGLDAVPLGVIKGLLSRNLEDWMQWPIFDRDGVLTIGYRYPNLNMAETYNAPGSPYWALKSFLVLALPDEHPFWHVKAEPMPKLEAIKHIPSAEKLIQHTVGHAVLYPSPVFRNDVLGHMPEKYGKFAYSSAFGFSVSVGNGSIVTAAPDSMLAFELEGYIFARRNAQSSVVAENNQVRQIWSPIAGIVVETLITLTENGHIRHHTITNEIADCAAYDCGFAVNAPAPNRCSASAEGGRADVRCDDAACTVCAMQGDGEAYIIPAAPNTNLIHSKTVIPSIRYTIPLGTTIIETEIRTEVNE